MESFRTDAYKAAVAALAAIELSLLQGKESKDGAAWDLFRAVAKRGMVPLLTIEQGSLRREVKTLARKFEIKLEE